MLTLEPVQCPVNEHVTGHVCVDTGFETRDLQATQTQPKDGRKKFHTSSTFEIIVLWCVYRFLRVCVRECVRVCACVGASACVRACVAHTSNSHVHVRT
jgi:hypothetical protein